MQSPSPQDFNHSLHPSLHCVRVLSFPFSFIFYFLTSFFLSLYPFRPVYSLVPFCVLETAPSRWSDRRQIFSLFRELTMRAGREEQKKEQARRMRERESRKAEEEKKVHQSPVWSSFFLLLQAPVKETDIFSSHTSTCFDWTKRRSIIWKACHHWESIYTVTLESL